ncbi:MAG: 50S ribosomal protein L31 [Bacilli bacterium]|nr:50S ribosomal protein L31 [Bacilli bacterium]
MRANIHPEMKETTVTCICGATFKTKSTKENINVEICSECHPFYTGTQAKAKKTGNIEKFNRKYGLDKKQKAA